MHLTANFGTTRLVETIVQTHDMSLEVAGNYVGHAEYSCRRKRQRRTKAIANTEEKKVPFRRLKNIVWCERQDTSDTQSYVSVEKKCDVGPRLWSDTAAGWKSGPIAKWHKSSCQIQIYKKRPLQTVPKGCQADCENTHRPDSTRHRTCACYTGAQRTIDKAISAHEDVSLASLRHARM